MVEAEPLLAEATFGVAAVAGVCAAANRPRQAAMRMETGARRRPRLTMGSVPFDGGT